MNDHRQSDQPSGEESYIEDGSFPIPEVVGPIEETTESGAYRSAGGNETELLLSYGYIRDEYFLTGNTRLGPYSTRILITRPKDNKKFSGIMVAEIFQTSVWLQIRDYMMRSGHGWIMISSRGGQWLNMLKNSNRERYANLELPDDELNPEIMYQVVNLLHKNDAPNPLANVNVRKVILAGYSGDGAGVRMFISNHHETAKFPDGRPVFNGYFVSATAVGSAPAPIDDIDIPVLEIMNENEMIRSFQRGSGYLAYRREDGKNYRLYEIPGAGHITSRGRQDDDPYFDACAERPLSQFPMNHLYSNLLHRMIRWVDEGIAPPHAERIEYLEDGKTIARDDHGNTLGGVRSTYLDVPTAAYNVVSTKKPDHASARTRCEMVAHAIPFSKEKLIRLYSTKDDYIRQVTERIDGLVNDGWYLEADADEIKREAEVFEWPQ